MRTLCIFLGKDLLRGVEIDDEDAVVEPGGDGVTHGYRMAQHLPGSIHQCGEGERPAVFGKKCLFLAAPQPDS